MLPNFPFRVEVEVISACNLSCTYCYAKPFTGEAVKFENLEYLFKKTKEEVDPFTVIILGGEPFLRKDIIKVLDLANSIFGGNIGVSSNGTMFDRLSKNELSTLKMMSERIPIVQISFDSIIPEINDLTRGKTGSTIGGLEILERNQIKFTVGIVVNNLVIESIPYSVEKLLSKYTYLKSINLEELQMSTSLGDYGFTSLKPSSDKINKVNIEVKNIISKLKRKDVRLTGMIDNNSNEIKEMITSKWKDNSEKLAEITRAGVFVNGDVSTGAIVRDKVLGNLYRDSWREIWKKAIDNFLTKKQESGTLVNIKNKI